MGCVNVHLGLIPYNRGKNPNVWPIIEDTPAGVSVHYINEGIDTGNIIMQREVSVEPVDTGETLYNKLTNLMHDVFVESWSKIKSSSVENIVQDLEKGTFHLAKDFESLNQINFNVKINPEDLINHLRAKTFPPHPQAYFIKDGRKIGVRIELEYLD